MVKPVVGVIGGSGLYELHDLIVELRSATLGVGSYSDRFDHLQELTGKLAERAMAGRGEQAAQ